MQDIVGYVLIIAAVIIPSYLIIEFCIFILQLVFANQSALISSPLP